MDLSGRLAQRLARHTVGGLDTSIFIYHLEANPVYLPLTTVVLRAVQAGQLVGITSVITLMELTVLPWRQHRQAVAQEYEVLLTHFPNLRLIDVTRTIARRAAQLRAHFNLRPADALQLAAALDQGATVFVTNDAHLRRVRDEIEILPLDEFAGRSRSAG